MTEDSYDSVTISKTRFNTYITGSDQVWNKCIIGNENTAAFTLAFTNAKKASYAASIGKKSAMVDNIDDIRALNIITVREKELQDVLSSLSIESYTVCDPVFLLSINEWKDLLKIVPDRNEKYVLQYYVDSGRKETDDISSYIAQKRNCIVLLPKQNDLKMASGRKHKLVYSDGPLEFLRDINEAEFVVACSFHAIALSIIFEKQFVAVLHPTTGARIRDMLAYLGLEDRIYKDLEDFKTRFTDDDTINYIGVKNKIEEWKNYSTMWLKKIVE